MSLKSKKSFALAVALLALSPLASADESYTTLLGLGHEYRRGDSVLVRDGITDDYRDGTITGLTQDGQAQVEFKAMFKGDASDAYRSILFDVKPANLTQSYRENFGLGHTYHVGDHVIADYDGESSGATILKITTDGDIKVKFDALGLQNHSDGAYLSVSHLHLPATDKTAVSQATALNAGLETALNSECPQCLIGTQSSGAAEKAEQADAGVDATVSAKKQADASAAR